MYYLFSPEHIVFDSYGRDYTIDERVVFINKETNQPYVDYLEKIRRNPTEGMQLYTTNSEIEIQRLLTHVNEHSLYGRFFIGRFLE